MGLLSAGNVANETEKLTFKFYLISTDFNFKKPHVATVLPGLTAPSPFSPSILFFFFLKAIDNALIYSFLETKREADGEAGSTQGA